MAAFEAEEDHWWVQKNGSKILIAMMDDSHLVNTIRMLNRHAKALNRIPARTYRRYVPLCAEAVRRGLEEQIWTGAWDE